MEWSVGSVPTNARGLRVLLVDNDTTALMYMASLLEEHSYKVTTTEVAAVAVSMIRERKEQYEVIIAEVNMPKINGFNFLHQILPQLDNIPIILMSVDPKGELARKALAKGASFFFEKPIPTRHLVNVWQHFFRKKTCLNIQHFPTDRKGKTKMMMINHHFVTTQRFAPQRQFNTTTPQKHTNASSKSLIEDKEKQNTTKNASPRIKWTHELHLKFIEALTLLGESKPNPKALLTLMDVPYLTQRHVASHLQKYRDRIKRISSLCESNAPFQSKSTYQFDGANKCTSSDSNPIPTVSMASQSSGSSVHLTLETLKRQLQFLNSNNTNNINQNGIQEGNNIGKGKQAWEAEGQCVNNVNDQGVLNNGGGVGVQGVTLDFDEVIKILEEDDYQELGDQSELMEEDSELLWDMLLSSSPPPSPNFSGGSLA